MTDHLATGMKRMIRAVARSASLSDRLGERSRLLRLTGNRSTLDFRPAEHGASSWDFEMSITPTEPKPYGNAETREPVWRDTHEYLDSGMTYDGFSEHVRTTWRNAAAYDWSKLMAEPRSTGEWSSDANRLAVLGVTMQFAPESTCMMIASDILAENAPLSLPALRERINTPDGMVNTDLLFSRLIDNGTTPDPARIDMAMGILGPLEANAPTDACYRIIGLKAMLSLAMGDGEKARELAEQAIGYDASDRFASSVLDRLPETDPAMEAANVWENGGHLGR